MADGQNARPPAPPLPRPPAPSAPRAPASARIPTAPIAPIQKPAPPPKSSAVPAQRGLGHSPTIAAEEPPPMSARVDVTPPPAQPAPQPTSGGFPSAPRLSSADASPDLPKSCSRCGNHYPADFLLCPRDATPLEGGEEGPDPLIDKVLGDTYRIVRVVGEGGMGRVYEAKHLRLRDRRVAVKVLHPEMAQKPDFVARFQREAESASAIDHPNVVSVFDVHHTPDGRPYLVGEFLEGEELAALLKRMGKLPVANAVPIVRQVCRALGAAHAKGVVHRDMKPENVFVIARNGQPHVKVLDFGISKAEQRETHLTKTGLIMGTPSYMAPEQARGQKVDARADVYAVGALLYQLVTGKPPFEAGDVSATLTLVLTREPERPRAIDASIPESLEMVIQRAMAKDPRDRFQTMPELEAALAPFDAAASPLSMMPPPIPSLPPPAAAQIGKLGLNEATRSVVEEGLRAVARSTARRGTTEREAKLARPTIVGLGAVLTVWLLGGFVVAVGGVVRVLRGGELTLTEMILLTLGTALAAATPAALAAAHVRRVVWPNSVRAVQLATDLWRTAAAALVTYGVASLLGRIATTFLFRSSSAAASGVWDVVLFMVSLVVAALAGGIGPLVRGFRRRAAEPTS